MSLVLSVHEGGKIITRKNKNVNCVVNITFFHEKYSKYYQIIFYIKKFYKSKKNLDESHIIHDIILHNSFSYCKC